ncbi:hypothetical protein Pfo_011722, partial [Paulownia fortunei]
GKYVALIQQFKNLEKEWKSLEKSRPRNPRTCSTGTDTSIVTSFDQLLESSPRGLMSSLQHRRSPSDGVLRVKKCDMAVEEILRDRRAAIMSGKLKGRRLFWAAERASEEEFDLNYGGGEICSDWMNMIQEREVIINENCSGKRSLGGEHELPVAFNQSCSFSDSSLSEEKVVVEEEKTVVEVANALEKRGGDRKLRGGGWCKVAMAWFSFVLILLTLGLISMRCNGKYVQENELIIVPT